MTRSLPEKTFEHWCSIHLNYRYRSHLQMWWPTRGEDIDAVRIPGAFGKRIWLELKTVEWNETASRHDLSIDLRQLHAYGTKPVPDYYVFPVPKWNGVLGDSASMGWLGNLPRPLLAYQTRSKDKWFADWTFVVPGHELRRCLAPEISGWLSTRSGETLRIAEVSAGTLRWVAPALKAIRPLLWKTFWTLMESCGSHEYPAQFILPNRPNVGPSAGDGGSGGSTPNSGDGGNAPTASPTVPRPSLVEELRLIGGEAKYGGSEELPNAYFYEQSVGDAYRLTAADGEPLDSGFIWDATRALVLLEVGALRL